MVGDAVTLVLLATGLACFAVAAVGVLRLLDALSRLHAVAMADNLGLGLIVAALAVPAGLDPAAVELAARALHLGHGLLGPGAGRRR